MTLHEITTYYQNLPHFAPQQVNSTEDMFSLKNLENFLDVIHHPEKDLFLIHVAGTNGKGSTVAFLQSALTYSLLHNTTEFDAKIDHPIVGTFTSPFLVSPLEMYRMDGAIVEEAVYISVMERLINIRESLPEEKRPSEYEMYTAAALCIFKELGCEFSILEVCMGGRLDATNVIPAPKVSVLTPIQYDHMEILGNTLTEIAREKCGILKPGTVCITAPQDPEAMDVIIDCCKELDIPLVESVPLDIKGLEAEFCGDAPVHEMAGGVRDAGRVGDAIGVGDAGGAGVVDKTGLHFKMRGKYQEVNAGTAASAALMCLRRLLGAGHTMWASKESEDKAQTNPVILDATLHTIIGELAIHGTVTELLMQGLAQATWPCRFEVIETAMAPNSTIILDGAHNRQGVEALVNSLQSEFPECRVHFVMGILRDKAIDQMIEATLPLAKSYTTVPVPNPRSMDAGALAGRIKDMAPRVPVTAATSIEEGIQHVLLTADSSDIICIMGSLYYVGYARALLQK